jgi:membrane peptidoglycan carboxypeptidase
MLRRRWILVSVGLLTLVLAGLTWWVLEEMRTSERQARYLAPVAAEATWWMDEGASESLVRAGAGPYDLRLGYHGLQDRVERVQGRGFRVVAQARVSPRSRSLVEEHQLFPIYRTKTQGGLTIVDREGAFLYHHPYPERIYPSFEDIPPVIWQTLLYIENRTALDPLYPYRNPAVEWGRLFRSGMDLGLRYLGREGSVAGASTLATQIEKFRHAPEGLTETPLDKLRQMGSAAVRAYQDGPETMEARKRLVRDYLNSVPLAAIRRDGEVTGLADGLRAWYGSDFGEVNRALYPVPTRRVGAIPAAVELVGPVRLAEAARATGEEVGAAEGDAWQGDPHPGPRPDPGPFMRVASLDAWDSPPEAAPDAGLAYRQVLSLILSQRRPSYFLTTPEGREALTRLTDRHLDQLERDEVVPAWLAQAARNARVELQMLPPERPAVSFVERKAVNTVRTGLLGLLDVPRLYDLDRMDLTVRSSVDAGAQATATELLGRLHDPAFIRERGFDGFRLLDRGDPQEVIYSIALHERTPRGNLVRIQVDNLDAPFNLNEAGRLELGSTAKLRTLATYLDVIAELHGTFSTISPDSLRRYQVAAQDRLSAWTRDRILARPDESLEDLLRAAMERGYSASPAERFVTGGGVQTFSNFDRTYDQQVLTVTAGFRHSVNLVFVRMMRDIVNHYMYRVPGSTAHVLEERGTPLRQEYLARFADREGIQFLNQFIPRFRGKTRTEILQALFQERRLSPQRMAWVYRTAVPDASVDELELILSQNLPQDRFSADAVADLFRRADPEPHSLSDLGYLANVHPLELWAARFFLENPGATGADAIRSSEEARQDVYQWLFRTSRTRAQDQRIRALLEVEAFTEIHRGWQRVGYPFQNIVPSLGTSIGSSGDRPAALNELVGIILNEGLRFPTYRVEELHFAPGTPYETLMERDDVEGERVMAPEVARVLREAMTDVVENGTARRSRGVVAAPDGSMVQVGGKTGTGDNRFRVFASGGRLVESRPVNRTSTFVFFIGDRYYGVISAYVPGEVADRYHFTSALPTQVLRELGPTIEGLLREALLPRPGGEGVLGPRLPGPQ